MYINNKIFCMKLKCVISLCIILFLISCASTVKDNQRESELLPPQSEQEIASNPETTSDEEVDELNLERENPEEEVEEKEVLIAAEPSEEEIYLALLDNIKITVINSPEGKKSEGFKDRFLFSVTDTSIASDSNYVEDFKIKITYPVAKKGNEYTFDSVISASNADGKVYFTPPLFDFSANTNLFVMPYNLETQDEKVLEKEESMKIAAPFKIKTSISSAVLFIWEYNELNKPTGNSYELISALRAKKIYNVGNAPVNESSDIGKPTDYIYKANFEIIGSSYQYLIGGTIKFVDKVTKVDDGYQAHLIADIYAIEMKSGNKVYENVIENIQVGTNWNNAVSKCKDSLAEKIIEDLFYSL